MVQLCPICGSRYSSDASMVFKRSGSHRGQSQTLRKKRKTSPEVLNEVMFRTKNVDFFFKENKNSSFLTRQELSLDLVENSGRADERETQQ